VIGGDPIANIQVGAISQPLRFVNGYLVSLTEQC